MTNYCQHLAPGLTLLKQFAPSPEDVSSGVALWFYEGPYV
jgi:hypothetical protein